MIVDVAAFVGLVVVYFAYDRWIGRPKPPAHPASMRNDGPTLWLVRESPAT